MNPSSIQALAAASVECTSQPQPSASALPSSGGQPFCQCLQDAYATEPSTQTPVQAAAPATREEQPQQADPQPEATAELSQCGSAETEPAAEQPASDATADEGEADSEEAAEPDTRIEMATVIALAEDVRTSSMSDTATPGTAVQAETPAEEVPASEAELGQTAEESADDSPHHPSVPGAVQQPADAGPDDRAEGQRENATEAPTASTGKNGAARTATSTPVAQTQGVEGQTEPTPAREDVTGPTQPAALTAAIGEAAAGLAAQTPPRATRTEARDSEKAPAEVRGEVQADQSESRPARELPAEEANLRPKPDDVPRITVVKEATQTRPAGPQASRPDSVSIGTQQTETQAFVDQPDTAPVAQRAVREAMPMARTEIVREAQMLRRNDTSELRVQLQPPELGRVIVEMQMRDGKLQLRMKVQDPEARETLREELDGLGKALRNANVDVTHMEVAEFASGRRGNWNGRPYEQQTLGFGTGGRGAPPDVGSGQSQDWAYISDSGRVDCLV